MIVPLSLTCPPVGRIGRSMDELYHLYASGGAFDVIDSEDMYVWHTHECCTSFSNADRIGREYLEHATVGIEDSLGNRSSFHKIRLSYSASG